MTKYQSVLIYPTGLTSLIVHDDIVEAEDFEYAIRTKYAVDSATFGKINGDVYVCVYYIRECD